MILSFKEHVCQIFLDWVNNYVSIQLFASDHGLTVDEARILINLGRVIHERNLKEMNG